MNELKRIVTGLVPTLISTAIIVSARRQQVSGPDPGLNAAVREPLQKPVGPLTEQDTQGFWIGKHEVAQAEYLAVTGENPSSLA